MNLPIIYKFETYVSPPCDLTTEEARTALRVAYPQLAKATITSQTVKPKGKITINGQTQQLPDIIIVGQPYHLPDGVVVKTFVKKSGSKG